MNATVERLAVRWILADPAACHDAELLLNECAHDALAAAFDDLTPDPDELIAIRSVAVPPMRFTYADGPIPSGDWARQWAAQVTRAVRDALWAGPPHAVRYPNRHAALVDLVHAAIAGDMGRAWAWRRLGCWPVTASASGTSEAARAELIHGVFTLHPDAILPVLAAVARTDMLPRLLTLLGGTRISAIADAAWIALGRTRIAPPVEVPAPFDPAEHAGATVSHAAANADGRTAGDTSGGGAVAAGIMARSVLARAVIDAGADLPPLAPHAVAALAALVIAEAEPPLLAGDPTIPAITRSIAERLHDHGGSRGMPMPPNMDVELGDAPRRRPAASGAAAVADGVPGLTPTPPAPEADVETTDHRGRLTQRATGSLTAGTRRRARTGNGGLFFLLHLVEPPESRWMLYRLGAELVRRSAPRAAGPDPADPALLGFCGLPPLDPRPEPLWDIDAAAERGELDLLAHGIELALRVRLAGRPAGRLDRTDLLALVIHRRAEIVADPGWIDVHLDLADVTVDLRAAGLDLDLGHVPWLGCVVRLIYE